MLSFFVRIVGSALRLTKVAVIQRHILNTSTGILIALTVTVIPISMGDAKALHLVTRLQYLRLKGMRKRENH